ncbi:MAG: hypothetical protein KTR15_08735 [Phycisphaeraceae bacterium]|nr:hypothetical protein [Phycisphaeraceae bacterium]
MNISKLTLGTGVALTALALIFFGLTRSTTALIPVGIGLPILLCGLAALKDNLRKHAVHAALVFALLGVLATLGMIPRIVSGKAPTLAATEIILMGVISAAFVAVGVKSFINARKAREAEAGPQA